MKNNKKIAGLALVTLLAPSLLNAQYVLAEEVQTEVPTEQQVTAPDQETTTEEDKNEEKQPETESKEPSKESEETKPEKDTPIDDSKPETKPENTKPDEEKETDPNAVVSFSIAVWDEEGTFIGQTSISGAVGTTKNLGLPLTPKHYEFVSSDNENVVPIADATGKLGLQITFPKTDATVNVVVREYPEALGGNITVKHLDDLGNEIADSVTTLGGFVGEDYTTEPKNLPGYILVDTPTNANGTFTDKEQTVTYRYDRVQTTVSVVCVDENGTPLGNVVSQAGKFKDTFKITAPDVPGYEYLGISEATYSTVSTDFSGTYGLEDQSFVATYRKIVETPKLEEPTANVQKNPITNVTNVLPAPVKSDIKKQERLPETGEAKINASITSIGLVLIAGVYFTKKKRQDEFNL